MFIPIIKVVDRASFYPAQMSYDLKSIAGQYTASEGVGISYGLLIDEKLKFVFTFRSDDGIRIVVTGYCKIRDKSIVLHANNFVNDFFKDFYILSAFANKTGVEFFPVHWDKRTYLIMSGKEQDFCNSINLGIEPSILPGEFLFKTDNAENFLGIFPTVPKTWEKFLFKKQISGKITTTREESATINLGTSDGICTGMLLFVTEDMLDRDRKSPNLAKECLVRVTKTDKHSSFVNVHKSHFFEGFTLGQPVVSKIPTNYSDNDISLLMTSRRKKAAEVK
jgi:hypothetical protein